MKGVIIDLYEEETLIDEFLNKLKIKADLLQNETSYYMVGCEDGRMFVASDKENIIKRIQEIFDHPIVDIDPNEFKFDYDYRRDLH